MKKPNQRNNYSAPIAILLLIALLFAGCAALEEAQQRKQERTRRQQQERYVTFERPDTEIEASSDSLTLTSEHYTFTFADDLLTHADYDEPEERQNVGKGALLFMESLYNYVHDIFGFEPKHQLMVNLRQTHHGSTNLATTSTRTQTIYQNGEWLKVVEGIEMDFPVAMFNQRDVRAHELTHAFTNIYLLPTWFAEGIAVLVQVEYARGKSHRRLGLYEELKTDLDGRNAVQYWKGHLSADQLTQWRYSYSYSIVAELKNRFGEDFYPTLFRLIEADQLHQRLHGEMTTSFLVYYLSQAAGQDLIPFFRELKFQVQQLTKSEILSTIMQANQEHLGR
ncbi:hypothetical protein F4X33_08025 [Candidatus Poribacteria bacterium]|nr:hypothetical protein [Candidatus Poribacteria bacterium]